MTIPLQTLGPCFQGLIPATLFTCSPEGVPNAAVLSHVDYVDARHVALSFQFFNKSRRNVATNPQALVHVYDPDTLRCYALRLRYVRSETSGPIFESMDLRIETIASHSGLKGIFKLLAADIYEVLSVQTVASEPGTGLGDPAARARMRPAGAALLTMGALQDLSARIQSAVNLESLLDGVLAGLEELLGFRNSMLLLVDERVGRLVTIASRGYPESGAGSEVEFGAGIIGTVAEARRPIRISGLLRDLLYASAVRARAQAAGVCPRDRQIPLPGLAHPESQLGIPLLVRGELLGVLCVESETPYRFHEEDKAACEVLGGYIAIALQNMLLQERSEEPGEPPPAVRRGARNGKHAGVVRHEVCYYASDECILVDCEYLIRSLPAKILWKLLAVRDREGRMEFTNRELRLDKSLHLPEYKDNLETRLLLLRRRLEQKCPDIRLAPCGRGRFVLEVRGELALIEKP